MDSSFHFLSFILLSLFLSFGFYEKKNFQQVHDGSTGQDKDKRWREMYYMCNLDTFPKALELWGCTFSFGRTAIEIVSVDVDTVDLVPSFSRESLNSYSPPVFVVVVVDQRVVPLLSLKWPLDVPINVHTTRQQVSTTVRHLKISHTMRHAPVTNATKRTHSLTSGWKIPDTTTVH
jgi:hypothetical protein